MKAASNRMKHRIFRKTKNPACWVERAGFEMNQNDQFVNYLPGSMESMPLPSRLGTDPQWISFADISMPAKNTRSCREMAVRGSLSIVALRIMCVEFFKEICNPCGLVNHEIDIVRKIISTAIRSVVDGRERAGKTSLHLLHIHGLQCDGDAVHPAVDFMVPVHQADRLGFGSDLQHLG